MDWHTRLYLRSTRLVSVYLFGHGAATDDRPAIHAGGLGPGVRTRRYSWVSNLTAADQPSDLIAAYQPSDLITAYTRYTS